MSMTVTDWTALIALFLSSGALLLEVRRWVESGVRVRLSVIADAISYPRDDGRKKLILTATNYGTKPTTVTQFVAHTFLSPLHRFFRKPENSYVILDPVVSRLPTKIEASEIWSGQMNYDDEAWTLRNTRRLFVGIHCSNRKKSYLIKVPMDGKVVALEQPS